MSHCTAQSRIHASHLSSEGSAAHTQVVTPEAISAMNERGEALRAQLNTLAKRRASLLHWTGMGSMMMAHFVSGPVSSPADVAGQDMRLKYTHLLPPDALYCIAGNLLRA